MPTPSAPNPEPSYTFTSTCPDPEEQQTPRSPSSWQPDPPVYANARDMAPTQLSPTHHAASPDEDSTSRSTTMSPQPQSHREGLILESGSIGLGGVEESHKQSETDDEYAPQIPSQGNSRTDSRGSIVRRRISARPDVITPANAESEKIEYSPVSGQEYRWEENMPIVGYDTSNLRVCLAQVFPGVRDGLPKTRVLIIHSRSFLSPHRRISAQAVDSTARNNLNVRFMMSKLRLNTWI